MLGDKRGEQCEDARVGTGRKAEVDLLEGDRGDGDSPALANPRQHVSAGTATRQLRQNVGVEQIHSGGRTDELVWPVSSLWGFERRCFATGRETQLGQSFGHRLLLAGALPLPSLITFTSRLSRRSG